MHIAVAHNASSGEKCLESSGVSGRRDPTDHPLTSGQGRATINTLLKIITPKIVY